MSEISDETIVEPRFELVPAAFDRIQLGSMRREIPLSKGVPNHSFDGRVVDKFSFSVVGDEFPEILRVEYGARSNKKRMSS